MIGIGKRSNRLYLLQAKVHKPSDTANIGTNYRISWEELHKRYGHVGYSGLRRLINEKMVTGVKIDDDSPFPDFCRVCTAVKLARRPFPQEAKNRSDVPGEITYADTWGPEAVASINKNKYFVLLTDDATRRCQPYFTASKASIPGLIEKYFQ